MVDYLWTRLRKKAGDIFRIVAKLAQRPFPWKSQGSEIILFIFHLKETVSLWRCVVDEVIWCCVRPGFWNIFLQDSIWFIWFIWLFWFDFSKSNLYDSLQYMSTDVLVIVTAELTAERNRIVFLEENVHQLRRNFPEKDFNFRRKNFLDKWPNICFSPTLLLIW